MARKTSITDIDAEIEQLRERRKVLLAKANERFAKAAAKAGLAELNIADDELDAVFAEIAARFQKTKPDSRKAAAESQ